MNRKKVIAVVILLLVAGLGFWYWKTKQNAVFYYTGTIEATKIDVPARLASVIAKLHVSEGAQVSKGQKLADLACEDIRIQAELIAGNFERGRRLVKAGSLPQDSFDQIKAKHDEIRLKLAWCSLEAPISGTVLSSYHEEGEWIAPGAKLLTLADLQNPWAFIYVPQPLLARLSLGMSVRGLLPEIEGKSLEGTIIKISEEAEFTPKNVQTREERTRLVFAVKIRFDNREGLLKPGMPIEVDLPGLGHD